LQEGDALPKVLTGIDKGMKVPIFSWADDLDDSTLDQAVNLASLPFAFNRVCLMADAHVGYGMPIGGVFAAEKYIIPNAVGVDIGCGVRAWCTNVDVERFMPLRTNILADIHRSIPTGFDWHRKPQADNIFDRAPKSPIVSRELDRARRQLGTLGGGNHFIEVQVDEQGIVWLMVHSGSRNLGKQVATHYNQVAKEWCQKKFPSIPASYQLACLDVDTDLGKEYIKAMQYCLDFAWANREHMMNRILTIWGEHFHDKPSPYIDVHHNYAAYERHFNTKLWVHRKGAVRAVGQVIVPGSMGTKSYICLGLENPESFCSCSHGAGRVLGRRQAKRTIPVDKVLRELEVRDIVLKKTKIHDVAEECPDVYKDIDEVMRNQSDLVKVQVGLMPLGVIKG
jgi:tRNA-splicing ligase RtcB